MPVASVNCPSCGAGHDIHNPGVLMYRCEYCGTSVHWDREKVRAAGKHAVLPTGFTRLFTGATGSLFDKRFVVLGRARYNFDRGFWDEWALEQADGSLVWLTEDNHELSLQTRVEGVAVEPFKQLRVGRAFTARQQVFVVEEKGLAECIGVEGDLPREFEVGETYGFVDASSRDGRYNLGIEYDDDPPSVFVGRWLKFASLQLDDEGKDW